MPSSASDDTVRLFLSYAREDFEAVSALYDRLEALGLRPWMDKRDLLPGQRWRDVIAWEVKQCELVLVCLSPQSVDKRGFYQREIRSALDAWQEKRQDDIYLIPVRLAACEVPEELGEFNWVDLYDQDGWRMLLRAIKAAARSLGRSTPGELTGALSWNATRQQQSWAEETAQAERKVQQGAIQVEPTTARWAKPVEAVSPEDLTITSPIRLELVRVPAGEFLMGRGPAKDKEAIERETSQHRLALPEFYIGKYPVTNEQYAVFLQQTNGKTPGHWQGGEIPPGQEKHPVVNVSWHDAVAFCAWLSQATGQVVRLPSEAEWEKAASWDAGRQQKHMYPWGDVFDEAKCNTSESEIGMTTPVGQYSPAGDSPCGAADMAGNVWEWCNSSVKGYPYNVEDGREDLDPFRLRILRGGSWHDLHDLATAPARNYSRPLNRFYLFGFRVVVVASSL